MRTYEKTHPWLSFRLALRKASPVLWLLLGEAQSKAQHVAGVPLPQDVQAHFLQLYLARGVLATTAIEGNTLSEEQVIEHLQGKLKLPPSKAYLQQEVANIVEACNDIGPRILEGRSDEISAERIREYNRSVLKGLPLDEEITPGEYRRYSVGVGRYRAAPPEDLDYLVERLCRWLNDEFEAPEGYEVAWGILKAILAHLYIAWIHPFGDGNGRTARLVEFEILLSVGVPNIAAHLLSNHYNQTRTEYYRQLDRAHRSGGEPLPFIEYALQGFVDALKEQIETIKAQQLQVHWINFVHEVFRDKDTEANRRRRRLVIDLSARTEPVPLSELRYVSPRIAEAYADKTEKTIQRDVNQLVKLGLLAKTKKGVRTQPEIMLAFLPAVRHDD